MIVIKFKFKKNLIEYLFKLIIIKLNEIKCQSEKEKEEKEEKGEKLDQENLRKHLNQDQSKQDFRYLTNYKSLSRLLFLYFQFIKIVNYLPNNVSEGIWKLPLRFVELVSKITPYYLNYM